MLFTGADGAGQEQGGLGDHPAGQVEHGLLFGFIKERRLAVCADFGAGSGHLAGSGGVPNGSAGESCFIYRVRDSMKSGLGLSNDFSEMHVP